MEYLKSSGLNQQQSKYGSDFVINLKKAYHKRNIIPLIEDKLKTSESVNILEFGPGLGEMADLLFETSTIIHYDAIDIDESILNNIKQKHPKSLVYNIDSPEMINQTFKNIKFDIILALDVWEHLPKKMLREYTKVAYSLLTNGGVMIIQVPNWGCPFTANTIYAGDLTHCNIFNEYSIKQHFNDVGIQLDEIEIFPYSFPYGIVGCVRTVFRSVYIFFYKLILLLLGLQVVSICTPNIIVKVKK